MRFSPTEYHVILALLHGKPVTDQELAQAVLGTDDDFSTREVLEKHMDKIRRKLRREQLPFFIRRLALYGYVLTDSRQEVYQRKAS